MAYARGVRTETGREELMRPYSVFLHEDILFQIPRSGRNRGLIMGFVRSLADNPFEVGDYQGRDDVGHELQMKIIGDYAVTFLVDHAAREVKILKIQSADRA